MATLKHVGRMAKNQRKCIVAYRVIPGDPDYCLVIPTESLSADEHDAVINAVESNAGQTAYEFAEAMMRTQLPDGRNMLVGLHTTGRMSRVLQSDVEMTPNTTSSVNLAELNKVIAEQKGVTVNDLALKDNNGQSKEVVESSNATPSVDATALYTEEAPAESGVITDDQLAAQYRSQADSLFKEAKRLREQAEELSPTKKKTTKKKTEESA